MNSEVLVWLGCLIVAGILIFNPDELRLHFLLGEQDGSNHVFLWAYGEVLEFFAEKFVDWAIRDLTLRRAVQGVFAFSTVFCALGLAHNALAFGSWGHFEVEVLWSHGATKWSFWKKLAHRTTLTTIICQSRLTLVEDLEWVIKSVEIWPLVGRKVRRRRGRVCYLP